MHVQGYANDEQKNYFYAFLVPEGREQLQEVQSLLQEISKDPGNCFKGTVRPDWI
jgi:hypothetical protein